MMQELKNKMTDTEKKELIITIGKSLVKDKLVQGTWGNISIRVNDTKMLVTPSGIDYSILTPEDLPIVDIHTLEWEGKYKPTTERKIHAAIYAARPDINAVIHTHPMNVSVFACARANIPLNEQLRKFLNGDVLVGAYGLPGTNKITKATIQALGDNYACMLANHGAFSCGTTMQQAYDVLKNLESFCEQYIIETASTKLFLDTPSIDAPSKLYCKINLPQE